jgi:Uma2 family endonuclease
MRGMPRQVAITVHDLEYMPDDGKTYEVIDGEFFASTSPSRFHQGSIGSLYFAIRQHLAAHAIGEVYFGLGIVRLKGAREIVAPALSPGTMRTASRSIGLDIEAKMIEIHRAGRTGDFQTKTVLYVNDLLTTPLLPGFECEVQSLFSKD